MSQGQGHFLRPFRQPLEGYERRLQDLERKLENTERIGQVVDVKYDQDKKRWFVKMNEGADTTPSGQDMPEGSQETFRTDWLPWKSFSHGAIKFSIPPRKGQRVSMRSPNGNTEMASVEPYHYGPDDPSPHDKQDEFFMRVQMPQQSNSSGQGGSGGSGSGSSGSGSSSGSGQQQNDPNQTVDFHVTKDGATVTIGSTTWNLTKDTVSVKTTNYKVEAQNYTVQASNVTFSKGS